MIPFNRNMLSPQRHNVNDEILEIIPLGAGSEVGRSSFLLKYKSKQVLFDCGVHPALSGIDSLPFFDFIDPKKIDIILISHFHLDHCGALPHFLGHTRYKGPVFMTRPTKAIISLLLRDYVRVTGDGRDKVDQPLFNENDLKKMDRRIYGIDYRQEKKVKGIKFWCYNAGHVLGAAMFMVEIAGVRVLYTGDYSPLPDRHLVGAEIPQINPHILMVEGTYGTGVHESREKRELRFKQMVKEVVERGGKCLIPVFALGRAQELLLILEEMWQRTPTLRDNVPIFYASNLAEKCMSIFETYSNTMNDAIRNEIENYNRNPFKFKHIRKLKRSSDIKDRMGPSVVLASPGMLQSGQSRELYEAWCRDTRNGVIVTGYSVEGTPAQVIQNEPDRVILSSGEEVDFRMSVRTISFSAHSDRVMTEGFIEKLSPEYIVLIHGSQKNVKKLRESLNLKFPSTQVFHPRNTDRVRIEFKREKFGKMIGKLAHKFREENTEWRKECGRLEDEWEEDIDSSTTATHSSSLKKKKMKKKKKKKKKIIIDGGVVEEEEEEIEEEVKMKDENVEEEEEEEEEELELGEELEDESDLMMMKPEVVDDEDEEDDEEEKPKKKIVSWKDLMKRRKTHVQEQEQQQQEEKEREQQQQQKQQHQQQKQQQQQQQQEEEKMKDEDDEDEEDYEQKLIKSLGMEKDQEQQKKDDGNKMLDEEEEKKKEDDEKEEEEQQQLDHDDDDDDEEEELLLDEEEYCRMLDEVENKNSSNDERRRKDIDGVFLSKDFQTHLIDPSDLKKYFNIPVTGVKQKIILNYPNLDPWVVEVADEKTVPNNKQKKKKKKKKKQKNSRKLFEYFSRRLTELAKFPFVCKNNTRAQQSSLLAKLLFTVKIGEGVANEISIQIMKNRPGEIEVSWFSSKTTDFIVDYLSLELLSQTTPLKSEKRMEEKTKKKRVVKLEDEGEREGMETLVENLRNRERSIMVSGGEKLWNLARVLEECFLEGQVNVESDEGTGKPRLVVRDLDDGSILLKVDERGRMMKPCSLAKKSEVRRMRGIIDKVFLSFTPLYEVLKRKK